MRIMNENATMAVVSPVYEDKEASRHLFLELKKDGCSGHLPHYSRLGFLTEDSGEMPRE